MEIFDVVLICIVAKN